MIRVLIVDDHALFRAGVRAELETRVTVVGEAFDIASAISAVNDLRPDVVLLDVHLPDGRGAEVIRATASSCPDTRFLALSVSDSSGDVIALVRAGARGYVTKGVSGDHLVEAIERVARGDAAFSPMLAGFVLDAFVEGSAVPDEELDRLSPREKQVMRLIARGYTYRECATELFVSIKTIETQVSSVLRKLQLSNRHELARWATSRRLVD